VISKDRRRCCLACGSTKTERVESVSVEQLANAWAPPNSQDATSIQIRNYVLADLGAERIEFWLCDDCGLEFAQPMKSWDHKHYPAESHSLGYDHQLALMELAKMPRMRILEIGCADGQFLELALRMGHETVGVDFSQEDVIAARQKGVNAQACDIADISGIACGSERFNLIALFQVIEHLQDPDTLFREIVGIAEPGAVLMIGCPSPLRYTRTYNHSQRIGRSDFWDYPPQHLLRWSSQSLTSFLQRFDFQTETIVHEPMPVIGAMAHLTALQGLNTRWYEQPWRRRLVSLQWLVRLTADRMIRRSTGIRLFVKARLKS